MYTHIHISIHTHIHIAGGGKGKDKFCVSIHEWLFNGIVIIPPNACCAVYQLCATHWGVRNEKSQPQSPVVNTGKNQPLQKACHENF